MELNVVSLLLKRPTNILGVKALEFGLTEKQFSRHSLTSGVLSFKEIYTNMVI
jgi:hypothetical protein